MSSFLFEHLIEKSEPQKTNMKDPKNMTKEELIAEYLRLGKKIDDIPFEKKANQDYHMFTSASLYETLAKSTSPAERFRLSEHLLWLHDKMLDIINETYDKLSQSEMKRATANKLLVDFKGNIRKRATKPRAVRRRGLV